VNVYNTAAPVALLLTYLRNVDYFIYVPNVLRSLVVVVVCVFALYVLFERQQQASFSSDFYRRKSCTFKFLDRKKRFVR
jgi:hypothetical protein